MIKVAIPITGIKEYRALKKVVYGNLKRKTVEIFEKSMQNLSVLNMVAMNSELLLFIPH